MILCEHMYVCMHVGYRCKAPAAVLPRLSFDAAAGDAELLNPTAAERLERVKGPPALQCGFSLTYLSITGR